MGDLYSVSQKGGVYTHTHVHTHTCMHVCMSNTLYLFVGEIGLKRLGNSLQLPLRALPLSVLNFPELSISPNIPDQDQRHQLIPRSCPILPCDLGVTIASCRFLGSQL